ncbi:MAG: acetyl-CoA carboxylase biotin carboxyl carrier protein subunit [Flavobacteriales bacterium]|nr:acetyl-CoA carboxylase biotin carboxyl carrier protein subunit [Flavobacteriales bacterium]
MEVNTLNNSYQISTDKNSNLEGKIDAENFNFTIKSSDANNYTLEKDGIEYDLDVINVDFELKKLEILINGAFFEILLKDKFDKLIDELGYGTVNGEKSTQIYAPMPGLVLNVLVSEDDEIAEGQPLIILEAMKMENIIKSSFSGKIKKVLTKNGKTVDKNEILIELQ